MKARAATLARGGLDAVGFVRSPFTIDGKQRLFAEPPHMQASMLFLPSGAHVPAVGDEVGVRVRFTATTFDRVVAHLSESELSAGRRRTYARQPSSRTGSWRGHSTSRTTMPTRYSSPAIRSTMANQ